MIPIWTLIVLALAMPATTWAADYGREIQPLLADHCYACHGPDEQTRKADLRFDDRDSALSVLGPEEVDESEVLRRLNSSDPEAMMPPPEFEKRPTEEAKALIRDWIEGGAPYEQHWAFEPIVKSPVPEVKDASWPSNEIDRFILARLEAEGMKPSPDEAVGKLSLE